MKRSPRRRPSARWLVLAVATGAALQYFLDPQRGRTRRIQTKDQLAGAARRQGRKAQRRAAQKARYVSDRAEGLRHEAATRFEPRETANDRELVDRVRSEVLGREEFRGQRVNVDAVDGVVDLRGVLDRSEQIRRLVDAVEAIDGVRRVESRLHLPGTPVPDRG